MNLGQLFDLTVHTRGLEPALEFHDPDGRLNTLTFQEVDLRAARMAAVLQSRGLRRGDRLCVHLANCIEIIDLYLACIKLGVIFVPINILYKDREMTHIIGDAEPAFIVDNKLVGELAAEALTASPHVEKPPLEGDDPA